MLAKRQTLTDILITMNEGKTCWVTNTSYLFLFKVISWQFRVYLVCMSKLAHLKEPQVDTVDMQTAIRKSTEFAALTFVSPPIKTSKKKSHLIYSLSLFHADILRINKIKNSSLPLRCVQGSGLVHAGSLEHFYVKQSPLMLHLRFSCYDKPGCPQSNH